MNTLQYEDSEVYDSLRRLEHVLNNRTETFTNKVESLIEVWKLVQDCRLTEHKQYVMHLMDWLKLHTLNIVLTGDWKKYKDVYEERLLKEVKHCEMLLLHSNNIFSFRCKKLAEVIKDPWGSPILGRLLNTPDLEIGPEEMEFFGMETGYLISTRLRKLCESHCEDLALNLVTAFMRFHQMAEVQHFTINATEDQKRFILDVYIALLYKYKRTHLIISTLKSLTLTEGLDLLKRFAHKRVNISKIWRHSGRIAYLAAQVYMTAAVMKIPSDGVRILEGLLDTWLDMPETVEDLVTLTATVRRIMQAADSPVHMYIFCKAFYRRFGGEMRTFIIELYIMALTTDINVLQRQKEEFNEAEERESSERLAYGFLKLADVLDQNLKLSRESVLTAFSLKPSQAILDRIVSLAKATSYDVIPPAHLWKCDHPPSDSSDDVSYKCIKCGEYKSYLELQSSLNSNTTLSDAVSEELDLSPHLRDDLVVVLSSPRYHFLNWLGTWKNLYHLCVIYLSDPVKTKNIITELKYVDIDYSLFVGIKREPEDENANGIERGYEHYLEDNYLEAGVSSDEHLSQDNCANEMASGNFHLLPPPATKSDPKVLKSLRLFRPNLKRSKPNQHDQMPPSKVFIPSPYFTPPHAFSPNPFHVPHATSNLGLSNYNNVFTQAASLPHLTNPQVSHNGKHAYQPSHNPITLQDLQLQLAAGYEQTVKNPLQKDVVLNLSIKDPPTLPMDLSKTNLKENSSEIHINDVSTAGNNHMRNKPVTMTHKKIVASNTPKVKISSVKQENNINKLIRPSVNNNTLTHQDYSYSTPTSSNYDDLVLRNSKNAGPSMQVFKNKNINYDRNISKNVCTPTNTPSSSPKNSPVKKRSVKQHSSSGKSPSKSLHSAMEYSVARKIPRTFSVHSSSEENANGINFTNPNSAQHIPLMKYLNNKPGFSKKSNELRSNTEAILHEEMKALRRATQSNAATSPSVIDPLNSEEFQITLESLLEVKKNPVLMALEEKRRSLEQYKLLFDDFNCGDPFEPHSSRYHSTTFDRMSEDCALGEDDDKWFSVYNSDEGSTSHVNEPINVSHPSYSPPQFLYTSSTTTNSINNSDTILIESSPENSCDKECHTQNNGRLTHYDVENFATKTEEVLDVSAENMPDSDRCGPDFNICQKLFEESEESSPSQEQETEEIIELSSSQQQETTKVSPTHTNSQLEDVSSPLLHGAVEPIINIDTFPDTPKKHNLSAYGLPFEVSKENIRSHANTSVEERMAVYRASLAVPKPFSSFNQDNRNFPINTQSNSEVIVINSTQATCSTKVLYINSQGCSSKNERVSSSTSSPVGSQGSNSEYEINSHVEMLSRSNSSNRNSLYGQDNSDEERNSSNDSLDSKLSEEKDTATDSDNRSISNDKCYRNTHNSNSSRDSVDTKASVEKDHITISDSESSSTNGKKSPTNSSRDSQQTNTSEDNASRTNSNSDVENSLSQDSSTNDSNSYHETQSSKDSQRSNSVNENLETNSHDSNIDDEGNSSRGFQETDLSEHKNVSTSSRDIKSADGRMSNAATESAPNTLNSTSDGENVPSSQCSSCDKARDSSMDVEVGNSFEERHSLLHSEESWSKLDDTMKVMEYFPSSPRLSLSYSRYGTGKYDSNRCHSSINSTRNVEEPYTAARAMCLDKPFGVSHYVPKTIQKGFFENKKENIKFKQTQDPAKNDSMCLGIQHNKKKTDSSITSIVKRSLELKCPPTCHIHYRIKEKEPLTLKKCDDSTLTTPFSDTVSVTDKKLSKNSDHGSSRHSFSEESNSQQSIDDSNGYEGSNNKKDSSVTSNGSLTCKAWPGVKVRSLDLEDLFLIRKGSVNNSERKLSTSSAELSASPAELSVSPAESVKDASLWKASNKRKLNKNIRHKRWETLSSSSEDERLCKINSGCNKSMNCISNEKESRVETLSPSSCSSDNTPCDNKKLKDERKIPNWCQILKNLPFVNSIQNFDDNFINFCGDDIKRYKSKHPDNAKNYSDLTNNFDEPCSSSESSESFNKRSNWRSTNYRKKKVFKSHPTIKETTKSLQTSLRKSGKVQEKNKNEYDLIKKYKLKDVRVVLYPLTYPDPKQDGIKHKEARCCKQKSKSGLKKIIKKSENLTKEKCRSKNGIAVGNSESKPWPLQDISPKVNRYKDAKNNIEPQEKPDVNLKTGINVMNPRVVLKRLEFDKDKRRSASSVLAQVPGLNDLQMIRPSSVDRIVQVVQVPGARSVNNIPIPNTQTSTQITPHIQRIGQPRTEKPLPSDSEMVVATTTATPSLTTSNTTTESPTLINILSQQVVRPGNQNNCVNTKPRTSPLINILSQQIIKPAATVTNSKVTSSPSTTEMQVNSIPRVISGGDQIINQLINQVRTPAPTLKTLVSSPGTDQNRIVQFICKSSDGKLIPVTSFTSNKVVKVSMAQTANASVSGTVATEENSGKVAQNTFKVKSETSEGSDTLPKFQQAFGKPTYQNNVEASESTGSNNETINSETEKPTNLKNQPKNSSASLNVQPVQGGVIYTRQVPVGQAINLIPPGRGQVFRIATSNPEQLSLVKDSVIQGKMSALLAAALQGKQRTLENSEADVNSEDDAQASTARVTLTARSPLIQNTRIVKPVLQIPSNVIRSTPQSNLSSTTLEQLREFDMVYKQVKERSSTNVPTESSPQSDSNDAPQQISVTYLNQGQKINCSPVVVVSSYCNVQPAASPSLSVTSQGSSSPCVTPAPTLTLSSKAPPTKNPKVKPVKTTTTHTTKASPIPKPQQKPQEDEHTTQRIFDILAEYAEQLRNSPDLNNKPAPRRRSNPPTNPNQNTKRKKSSSSKKTGQSSNSLTSDGDIEDTHTVGSEDSSCGIVQISVQDDEQALTTVNTSENSEASASPKQLILTDSTANQSHSLIIADSNVGEALKMSNTAVLVPGNYIMPVSMVKGGQQIAVVSGGSKILATVPARSGPNMLLFQSFLNQSRKHTLPTVKYSTIQPLSGISRSMPSISPPATIVPASASQNLTTVTLSPSVGLQKVNQMDRVEVNNFDTTEVYLAISQPQDVKLSSQQNEQSITPNDIVKSEYNEDTKEISDSSITTSAIVQTTVRVKEEISDVQSTPPGSMMALNLNTSDNDKDTTLKVEGRVQSVLVTGTSNGPMLSHNPPTYKQVHSINSISESNKDEYLRNDGKHNSGETKSLSNSTVYPYHNKMRKSHGGSQRLDRELHHLTLQRKAAIERELRLQKSLSEECEDLGVDEPSASDLFPEADLPFDSNHSPSYDQTSQDLVRRIPCVQEVKEETRTIGLFCDDEPLRTDFLFEPIEYQPTSVDLSYEHSKEMRNGQGSLTGLTSEDNTLLQTCTTMSDVTIPSPISPEPYADLSPLTFNKRKYSYSNRKKLERIKQPENWSTELSSSEDTTGSSELISTVTRSPDPFSTKRDHHLNCDDELYEFAIVERLPLKDDQACENIDCEAVAECPSGRGCRRSVKKTCSCCNLTLKVARKRPASRPTTPIKKTVPAKKR